MLNVKWFIFFFMAFALLSLLSGVADANFGADMPWQPIMETWEEGVTWSNFFFKAPALGRNVISAIWNMFTWNYTFLQGVWWGTVVRLVVFMPISAGLAISLIISMLALVRGTSA